MRAEDYFAYARRQRDDAPLYLFDAALLATAAASPLATDAPPPAATPACFSEDLLAVLGEEGRPQHRWLIVGPARSGSSFHVDPNATSAWNAVVRGSKLWCALYFIYHFSRACMFSVSATVHQKCLRVDHCGALRATVARQRFRRSKFDARARLLETLVPTASARAGCCARRARRPLACTRARMAQPSRHPSPSQSGSSPSLTLPSRNLPRPRRAAGAAAWCAPARRSSCPPAGGTAR